jgi:hypothetical protein
MILGGIAVILVTSGATLLFKGSRFLAEEFTEASIGFPLVIL